jgi:hypothetical protein
MVAARKEMVEARALSVRPRLAFDLMVLGGKVGLLLIRNVGNGVALNVSLDLIFGGAEPDARHWTEPSFVPGESHELKLPEYALRDIGTLADDDMRIHIRGVMYDVNDEEIRFEEVLLASEWWRTVVAAQERVGGRRKLPGVDPRTWGLVKDEDAVVGGSSAHGPEEGRPS